MPENKKVRKEMTPWIEIKVKKLWVEKLTAWQSNILKKLVLPKSAMGTSTTEQTY